MGRFLDLTRAFITTIRPTTFVRWIDAVSARLDGSDQLSWYIDESNVSGLASDNNSGISASAPLLTDDERVRRMGGRNADWRPGSYHLYFMSAATTISLLGRISVTTQIFVHGNVIPGTGILPVSGTITAITPLSRGTNQPWILASSTIVPSRTHHRVRLQNGALGWLAKSVGATSAECSEFNVPPTGYVFPFIEPTGESSPILGDSFVLEELVPIARTIVDLIGRTPALLNTPQVIFDSLDLGSEVFQGTPAVNAALVGCIFRSASTTMGCWGSISCSACQLAPISGLSTWSPPRVLRLQLFGGYANGTNKSGTTLNLQTMNVGIVQRFMSYSCRVKFLAAMGNDNQGFAIFQLGVFDSWSDAIVMSSPGAVVLQTSPVLWGKNNVGHSLEIRSGCSLQYFANPIPLNLGCFPIVSSAGDVLMAFTRPSIPAFDVATNTYTADRLLSWTNILATIADGGFCSPSAGNAGRPSIVDPFSGCAILSV